MGDCYFSFNAIWKHTVHPHSAWLIDMMCGFTSTIFDVPGFSIEYVKVDWMHSLHGCFAIRLWQCHVGIVHLGWRYDGKALGGMLCFGKHGCFASSSVKHRDAMCVALGVYVQVFNEKESKHETEGNRGPSFFASAYSDHSRILSAVE